MALQTYSWTFGIDRTITKIAVISTSVDEARRQVLMQLARNTVGARRKAEIDATYTEAVPKHYNILTRTSEDDKQVKAAYAKHTEDADELRAEVEEEAETFFGNFGGDIFAFTETVDVGHEAPMSLSDFIRHVEPKVTPFKPIWIIGVYDEWWLVPTSSWRRAIFLFIYDRVWIHLSFFMKKIIFLII